LDLGGLRKRCSGECLDLGGLRKLHNKGASSFMVIKEVQMAETCRLRREDE
jgi:hypothetical protein